MHMIHVGRARGHHAGKLLLSISLFSAKDELPSVSDSRDFVNVEGENSRITKMYASREDTTWRERLNLMWRVDDYGDLSPELRFVREATTMGILCGGIFGAYKESLKVTKMFLDKNKHQMFRHPREAQSSLQDRAVLAYINGFWRSGWRIGLLVFTYASVSQTMTAVRNYINPLDHGLAGAIMGGAYRINMGPKGMAGGAFVGSLLGIQAGLLTALIQYCTGETVSERWQREYSYQMTLKELKDQKLSESDIREGIVTPSETKAANTISPGSETRSKASTEEVAADDGSEKWLRQTIISLRTWAMEKGLLTNDRDSWVEADNNTINANDHLSDAKKTDSSSVSASKDSSSKENV